MNKNNFLTSLFIFLAVFVLSYAIFYFYSQLKDRYTPKDPTEEVADENDEGEENIEINFESLDPDEYSKQEKEEYCSQNCENITNPEELEICQETCDIEKTEEYPEDCNELTGITFDNCLKEKATHEKDYSVCAEVSTPEGKKACENRVTEELIESSFQQKF